MKSNNGREYLSHSFKKIMGSHGILHKTSCAYTPQQNEVVEHKNKHLIETTCIILIMVMFLGIFGVMMLLVHVISLIACHLQF